MNETPECKELEQKIKSLEDSIQLHEEKEESLLREIEELRQIKNYYDILMQNTEDLFLICDKDAKPLAFNDSFKNGMEALLNIDMKPGVELNKVGIDSEVIKYLSWISTGYSNLSIQKR